MFAGATFGVIGASLLAWSSNLVFWKAFYSLLAFYSLYKVYLAASGRSFRVRPPILSKDTFREAVKKADEMNPKTGTKDLW
jgi:hypothetical protein